MVRADSGPLCSPWVASQRGVVQGVEAVAVGQRDVGVVVQQQAQHVVPLLGDGVVQRRVSILILRATRQRKQQQQ